MNDDTRFALRWFLFALGMGAINSAYDRKLSVRETLISLIAAAFVTGILSVIRLR